MLAFIIRPFGVKQDLDFERVQAELLRPAFAALDIQSRTLEETQGGAVREALLASLLTADLVVADVSLQSAKIPAGYSGGTHGGHAPAGSHTSASRLLFLLYVTSSFGVPPQLSQHPVPQRSRQSSSF